MSSPTINGLQPVLQPALCSHIHILLANCAVHWLVIELHRSASTPEVNAATTCCARRDCRSCCRSHCKSTPCSLSLFPGSTLATGNTNIQRKCSMITANNVPQTPTRMQQLPKHGLHNMFCAGRLR